jgi:hypothetical protein
MLHDFPSFGRMPSWVNRAGRIDRAACLELRASDIWRTAPPQAWRAASNRAGPIAYADIPIDAHHLARLHDSRPARALAGDLRTPKSNAMKNPGDPPGQGGQRRKHLKPGDQPWRARVEFSPQNFRGGRRFRGRPHDLAALTPDALAARLLGEPLPPELHTLLTAQCPEVTYPDPNRGEMRTKMLGLHADWMQTVRVERWDRRSKGLKASRHRGIKEAKPPMPRSLGASLPPSIEHFLLCPQCRTKRKKLYMVLAFEQEVADAEIAEGMIRMIDSNPALRRRIERNAAQNAGRAALIDRYAMLFRGHDRKLTCADCLGLRWGEVKTGRRFAAEAQRQLLLAMLPPPPPD